MHGGPANFEAVTAVPALGSDRHKRRPGKRRDREENYLLSGAIAGPRMSIGHFPLGHIPRTVPLQDNSLPTREVFPDC